MRPWSQPLLWSHPSTGGTSTTWNPADKSANITLSNGNLTATNGASAGDNGVRSVTSKSTGKYYVEFTITGVLSGADTGIGIATGSAPLTIGATSTGGFICYPGTGNIYFNGSFTGVTPGGSTGIGTVWCMAIDLVNSKGWFRINGGNWDGSGTDNPATNTGGINIATLFPTNAAYAFFCANANAAGVTANFGTSAFSFTVPSGFSAWGAADVPAFAVPTAAFPRVACSTLCAFDPSTAISTTVSNGGLTATSVGVITGGNQGVQVYAVE